MDKLYCLNCKQLFNDVQNTRKRKYQLSLCKIHFYQADKAMFHSSNLNILHTNSGGLVKRKKETNESVGIFWKWIHSTIFKLEFDKIKNMDRYNTSLKFIINCPYCLSNNIINATEFIEQNRHTYEDKQLPVYNKTLAERKILFDKLRIMI